MATKYKRFSPDVEAFIRNEYRKGKSDKLIAERLGCLKSKVKHFRARAGLVKKAKPTPVDTIRRLAGEGLTAADIAQRLDVQKRAVLRIAYQHKIEIKPAEPRAHAHQPWRDEPPVGLLKASFAALIGARRYENDPRSLKPVPGGPVYRPPTHVVTQGFY